MSETQSPEQGRFIDRPPVRSFLGKYALGGYLRLIRATSTLHFEPADHWDRVEKNWPVIALSWHGQSNVTYAYPPAHPERWSLLVSNHPDGQMAQALAKSFGYRTIVGSGMSDRQRHGTGGVGAFRAMLRSLKDGQSLFMTADIPPTPGRNVSPGVIALARRTGRPVYAMAGVSSRRKVMDRVWDKMQFNFPFSRIGYVFEEPIWMTDESKSDEESARELTDGRDRPLARATALADQGKA